MVEIPDGQPRDKCNGAYIGANTRFADPKEIRCGVCKGCHVFDYARPKIEGLWAGPNKASETYKFKGGELLTVVGRNFGSGSRVDVLESVRRVWDFDVNCRILLL